MIPTMKYFRHFLLLKGRLLRSEKVGNLEKNNDLFRGVHGKMESLLSSHASAQGSVLGVPIIILILLRFIDCTA